MAYFRCATGGGAGATITVTYTSDFYGETITCSHGTKTYTKVATSSGTVDFTVDEEGTWTISCLGFTDTADVDLSYSADLVAVPDGKTATPTDDIEKWLACGQITGKSYTTLSQVLADAETYERLLSDSNACDYMARSTTWASTICADADAMMRLGKYDYACDALLADSTWCTAICGSTYFEYVLDVKVPVMTSNTTPSGEVIYSTQSISCPAWYAFDGNTSGYPNMWQANERSASWIGYQFTSSVNIKKVRIYPLYYNLKSYIKNFTIDAYDTDWNTLYTGLADNSGDAIDVILTANTSSEKFRLYISDNYTSDPSAISELQFYGRHTAQTDIIVTAHGGDTVYYMENGSPVPLTTADSDTGIGTVDWSDLPKGAITLYSSTAKNPSDLTADYSKTVYITEYTTQIYLMPDNALYWWGHFTNDCEVCSSENGWANVSNRAWSTPTLNTKNVSFAPSSNTNQGIGKKTLAKVTKLYAIASTTPSGGEGSVMYSWSAKTGGTINGYQIFDNTAEALEQFTPTDVTINQAVMYYVGATRSAVLKALFCEIGA